MNKKYIPKYYPSKFEGYDSDEIFHLRRSLQRHEKAEELKKYIIFNIIFILVMIVVIIVFVLINGG